MKAESRTVERIVKRTLDRASDVLADSGGLTGSDVLRDLKSKIANHRDGVA